MTYNPKWKQKLAAEVTRLVNTHGRSPCDAAETLYVRLVSGWYPDEEENFRQYAKDKLSVVHQRLLRRGAARARVQAMTLPELLAYVEIGE